MSLPQPTEKEAFVALAAQTDETPETMANPTAWVKDAMREHWRNRIEAWLAERGVKADVVARWYGPFIRDIAQLPDTVEEPPPPPAMEPPDLIPSKRMAEQSHENGILFWWPDPTPGLIYILWTDGSWETLVDCKHPGRSGFEWATQQRPLIGHPRGDEQHGLGLVRKDGDAVWVVAPSDLDVFVLLPNGSWQLVEA